MQRKKTFIVGAGASKELGLPTGGELTSRIEDLCRFKCDDFGNVTSGDRTLRNCFRYLKRDNGNPWGAPLLAEVAEKLRQNMGLAPSIDNFLGAHTDKAGWSEVGKLAIARAILNAERSSSLWFDTSGIYNRPSFAALPSNWLTELFRILVAGRDLSDFKNALDSCRFVTFNYDRVIEHFFHQAIGSYFELHASDVDELCASNLHVVHIYGSLGDVSCANSHEFGQSEDYNYVISAAERIKVFTEGTPSDLQIERAKYWIKQADVLIILGLGYLPLNLRILKPDGEKYPTQRRLLTSKGVSPNNLEIAQNIIRQEWYGGMEYLMPFENVYANELIWQNSFFLSEADLEVGAK